MMGIDTHNPYALEPTESLSEPLSVSERLSVQFNDEDVVTEAENESDDWEDEV